VPRGAGPDYCNGVGLGSCRLIESDGFSPTTKTIELGPKSRPANAQPVIAFASAQVTEPEPGGPVTLVLDTRSEDGANEGAYEHDFALPFDSRDAAVSFLAAHGFDEYTLLSLRPLIRANGSPRLRKDGTPALGLLPTPEKIARDQRGAQ
jgi:hypothetical protein